MSQNSNPDRTCRVRDPRGGKWFFIHNALASTWRAVLADLRLQMIKSTFEACLRRTRAVRQENGVLTVAVPDERGRQ